MAESLRECMLILFAEPPGLLMLVSVLYTLLAVDFDLLWGCITMLLPADFDRECPLTGLLAELEDVKLEGRA